MYHTLESSLFVKDKKRFGQLHKQAIQFNSVYIGANIIQDDIFNIVENYAGRQEIPLELLRYPIADEEFCACTFLRSGRIFIVLNASMSLAKQIFAVTHELYHIYCFFEEENQKFIEHGSILNSDVIDEHATAWEDTEANAFAGLILAPTEMLMQQIEVYGIQKENIRLKDILMLMDIFAIPYKAVILRLFESGLVNEEKAKGLLTIPNEEIQEQIQLTGKAKRWQQVPTEAVQMGSLLENMNVCIQLEAVREERLQEDMEKINTIRNLVGYQ